MTDKAEGQRLADALRALHDSMQPHPMGPHGQMLGEETYRIVASGNSLYALMEAHDLLRRWPDGEPVAWRPEVVAFASLMERELRENDWKGGWKHCDFASLMSHVWEEARELQEALLSYPRDTQKYRERIASEGADVANMVMMVLDVRGALSPSAAPPDQSERIAALEAALGERDRVIEQMKVEMREMKSGYDVMGLAEEQRQSSGPFGGTGTPNAALRAIEEMQR